MPCSCTPLEKHGHEYVQWIGSAFQTCAWTPRDVIAFCVGLGNIGFWMFAQVPQLWANYQNQSVDSLSGLFLCLWLLGDITNFVGCITTNQSPVQLYTSIYFLCMDVLTLSQYYYYYKKNKPEAGERQSFVSRGVTDSANYGGVSFNESIEFRSPTNPAVNSYANSPPARKTTMFAVLFAVMVFARHYDMLENRIDSHVPASVPSSVAMVYPSYHYEPAFSTRVGRVLLSIPDVDDQTTITVNATPGEALFTAFEALNEPQPGDCNYDESLGKVAERIGTVSAWLSGLIYVTSRIPQILRNHSRKSTEGLSLGMFVLAMLGNTCYGISILLPEGADLTSKSFFLNTFPYLIGSLGTNVSAIIILFQAWIYRHNKAPIDINMDTEAKDPFSMELSHSDRKLSQTILI